jgi:hypothetical protein
MLDLSGAWPVAMLWRRTLRDESIVTRHMAIEGIKGWADFALLSKDVALNPPWKHTEELMAHEGPHRYSEDVVELFESTLLRLGDEKEDHAESQYVESCVETKGARRSHGIEHTRDSDRKHCSPEKASRHAELCHRITF